MAKRLTDTDKWKDDWYISLSNDYRIIWQWLLDNCSHAGICKRSIGILNMMCKTDIIENSLISVMEGRVIPVKNDWFIPKFLKFQYTDLHSNRPVIVSVRRELIRNDYYKLIPESFGNDYTIIPESLDNDYLIIKDKDKDKDKRKDKVFIGNKKNLKGSEIKNGKVYFEDGSAQLLGKDQSALLEMGELKPQDILQGSIS